MAIGMSGKNYLLDTKILIGLFASEASIVEKIKSNPTGIFIPSIVLGELFYGAEQSTKKEENRKKIDALALPFGAAILYCFAMSFLIISQFINFCLLSGRHPFPFRRNRLYKLFLLPRQ